MVACDGFVWSTPPIASLSPLLPPQSPPLLYEITVARDLGGLSCSASVVRATSVPLLLPRDFFARGYMWTCRLFRSVTSELLTNAAKKSLYCLWW